MEVTNSWLKQLDTLSDILPYSTSETLPYLGMVIRKIPLALFWLIAIPIDHCLISPELTVTGIWTGPNVGSDHLPLITDLAIAADHKP
ncbi:hypothetical protein [Leptothermofonsia sp. ETS-13]|uniref:hypothetical protein n=1 Tax=Leptothermofonsia sp. ETS-13 TaxID=3035696 RepID=UPI003BA1BA06